MRRRFSQNVTTTRSQRRGEPPAVCGVTITRGCENRESHCLPVEMVLRAAPGSQEAHAGDERAGAVGQARSTDERSEQRRPTGGRRSGREGAWPRGTWASKPRSGHSTGEARHRRWNGYVKPDQRLGVWTRGKSRMRENCTSGSVEGAAGNRRPYSDPAATPRPTPPPARDRFVVHE
jgi:hypothetical protein